MNNEFWATELKQMKTAGSMPGIIGGLAGAGLGALANYQGQSQAREDAIYDHPDQANEIDAVPTDRMSILGSGVLGGLGGGYVGHRYQSGLLGAAAGTIISPLGGMTGRRVGRSDVREDAVDRARDVAALSDRDYGAR